MTSSSNYFDEVLFLLWSLVTGPSFMSISSLVLELTLFFYKGLTRNLEIHLSGLCPISGDWCELGIPDLAQISLIKYYWMLQNARVTAFTISKFPYIYRGLRFSEKSALPFSFLFARNLFSFKKLKWLEKILKSNTS